MVLISLGTSSPEPGLLTRLNLPTMLTNNPSPDGLMPSLSVSSSGAVKTVLSRLLSQKCEQVTCVSNSPVLSCSHSQRVSFQGFTRVGGLRFSSISFAGFSPGTTINRALQLLKRLTTPATFVCRGRVLTTTDLRTLTTSYLGHSHGDDSKSGHLCPCDVPTVIDFRSDFMYRTICPSVASIRHSTNMCNAGITGLLLGILTKRPIDKGHGVLAPGLVMHSDADLT